MAVSTVLPSSLHAHKYFHSGLGQQIQAQMLQLLSLTRAHGELDILIGGMEGGGGTADERNSTSSHAFFNLGHITVESELGSC